MHSCRVASVSKPRRVSCALELSMILWLLLLLGLSLMNSGGSQRPAYPFWQRSPLETESSIALLQDPKDSSSSAENEKTVAPCAIRPWPGFLATCRCWQNGCGVAVRLPRCYVAMPAVRCPHGCHAVSGRTRSCVLLFRLPSSAAMAWQARSPQIHMAAPRHCCAMSF